MEKNLTSEALQVDLKVNFEPWNGLSERILPMGFGNSVIYSPEHSRKNASFHFHRLATFVVVVSPLEYIRKQQVPKTTEYNFSAAKVYIFRTLQ